ncbi:hypothetical protein [Aestuariispira insulae]|uniref:Uncharacterized protein n=1 Tax=Aestuariispira insulae TaxID=1461337 RepID=A0A3D9H1H4_9PROT|nr:hypothetical protein [Aestuariispira insulae]RED43350.1 hypothetical protein DFP90_1248 [Aestuariispira insulae]
MSNQKITFSDGILELGFFNGMVHFSIGHVLPAKEGEETPRGVVTERYAMQPKALLQSMQQMERMAKRLVERGVFLQPEENNSDSVDTDEAMQIAADD